MSGFEMSIFDPLYRQEHTSAKVARALFTISKAIKHIEWEKAKLEHLTPTQIESLLFLNYVRPNAATVNALAKQLSCKPATVSGILDTLENKKFILRSRKSSDRRHVLLSLTHKGFMAVKLINDLGKEIEEIISGFNEKEQKTLEKLLMKLSRKLLDKGYVFTTEICNTCIYFDPNKLPGSAKPHYCKCLKIVLSEKDIYKECPEYKEALI